MTILSNESNHAERIFWEALQRDASERDSYIAQRCADDDALRAEVESLLRHHEQAADLFPSRVGTSSPAQVNAASMAGCRVGRYTIVRLIASGGMGSVFEARQENPSRLVALKLMRATGWTGAVADSPAGQSAYRRFEYESQILARLHHPGIAQVFEAGTHDDEIHGSTIPFFAMEYIPEAQSIIEFAAHAALSTRGRVELFIRVCSAVHHGHQRGIIHRDLKPSNILIDTSAGAAAEAPQPKVIDFGVARCTDSVSAITTVQTSMGQLIGTLQYMSPEQCAADPHDLDVRTDVYSLGVVLYELLCGRPPYDVSRVQLAEATRMIREDPPTRPSSIQRALRGDLETIALKAIQKDRARRYQSVAELADDLQRYLRNQPIKARPPSIRYQFRTFARRNKAAVTAAAAVFVALSAGFAAATWQALRATNAALRAERAETAAERDRDEAISQAERAERNEQRAIDEADRAEREAQDALAARAETQQRAEELERVVTFQASQLSGIDAAVMGASLRSDIVRGRRAALARAGESEDQIGLRIRELDQSLADVSFTNIALNAMQEHIFEPTLRAVERQFSDPLLKARMLQTVASTMSDLGLLEAAIGPQVESLEIRRRRLGDEDVDTLASGNAMGLLLQRQGNLVEAEQVFRQVLDARRRVLGEAHPSTINTLSNVGFVLRMRGQLAQAQAFHREAVDLYRRVLGDDDPATFTAMANLAVVLRSQGKFADAEKYDQEALQGRRRVLGETHRATLESMNNVGMMLQSQGRSDEAEEYFRHAMDGYRQVLGNEHPDTLTVINNVGFVLQSRGHRAAAEPYFREALEGRRRVLGEEHADTLTSINNMGYLLQKLGRADEAEPYLREALEKRRRVLGDEHPDTVQSINNMGFLLSSQGDKVQAELHYRQALEVRRRVLGHQHPDTLASTNNLGSLLREIGKYDEAQAMLLPAVEVAEVALPAQHRVLRALRNTLARLYDAWHAAEPDGGHDRRAAEWRARLKEQG